MQAVTEESSVTASEGKNYRTKLVLPSSGNGQQKYYEHMRCKVMY